MRCHFERVREEKSFSLFKMIDFSPEDGFENDKSMRLLQLYRILKSNVLTRLKYNYLKM